MTNRKYNTIIFDWDGTLHKTELLYISAFNEAYAYLVENNYAPKREFTDKDITKYLGMTADEMWKDFMPDLDKKIQGYCSRMVGDFMIKDIAKGKAKLYDGALDMLSELKEIGYTLAILSNCGPDYLKASRDYFGLDRFFTKYYPAGEYGFMKKPEIAQLIKDRKELPGEFIMIGDRDSDMSVGAVPDIKCIGCSYGYGEMKEYISATAVAHNITDIPDLISALM